MPLINCEINLFLTWSEIMLLLCSKLYVSVVNLSTQVNTKLLQQLKSGFKRTINWNKYQSKLTKKAPNPYLDFLIDPIFQGVSRVFVFSFEDKDDRKVHTEYYLPKVEIKDCNVMIDGKILFGQPVKGVYITYVRGGAGGFYKFFKKYFVAQMTIELNIS